MGGLRNHLHGAWLFLWMIMLIVMFMAFHRYEVLRDKDEKMNKEIERLTIENRALAGKVNRIKTDPSYVEKIARQKLGLAEKGEVIYIIMPEEERR